MVYSEEERAIIYYAALSGLDRRSCAAALRAPKDLASALTAEEREKTDAFLASLEKDGMFAFTVASDDYPESLKAIPDPPLVLYGAGNRALLKEKKFCIVGSRITPPWAEKVGKELSQTLSEHFAIVTGLAEGGDSAAIAGAIQSGNLISVLPCGLAECYPAAHAALKEKIRNGGLLLSEYLPHMQTAKYSFHARNRLLAGLSEGVLVLSAGERSGTLITASRALEYGRDVFALPYNLGVSQGAGCNDLIKKGAYLVTCAADILSCYGIEAREEQKADVTEDEERLLSLLRSRGEMHPAELASALGIKVYEISALLSSLEIKGLAVKSGGNKYSAV